MVKVKIFFVSFLIQSFIVPIPAKVYLVLGIFISPVELKCHYKSVLSFDSKESSNFMVDLADERFNSKLFKACECSVLVDKRT